MHIHICMHTYVYTYINAYADVNISICTHRCICMHTDAYAHIYTHACTHTNHFISFYLELDTAGLRSQGQGRAATPIKHTT